MSETVKGVVEHRLRVLAGVITVSDGRRTDLLLRRFRAPEPASLNDLAERMEEKAEAF
jgi:hypothetical protein